MNYYVYLNTKKLNKNEELAVKEYTKRLSAYCKTAWYCHPATDCISIISKIKYSEHTLFLQVQADEASPSSEELANDFNQMAIQGISTVYIFIGYPHGTETSEPIIKSMKTLSLSSMTLSTGLTSVVFYEQLYRCYRILNNQPYHK
ncbi:MAG: 23S rRNA (pseudouridine(1915)-N(3))-methyltransferase RlmH [Lachnospiraceae bacterium]|nr:23S rRNA (pseudouridine(1915)-N(3))-methyltransferase RlmH [Lachnospiraceae bacterium]